MISFSGIDCSGKSTQIGLIENELKCHGKKYQVIWSRGGYTPGIGFIKKILRGGLEMSREERIAHSEKINKNSKKRKLIFIASLMDLWFYYTVLLRIKGIGKLIICDRYIWDTYIDFKMKYPDYKFDTGFWWKATIRTMVKPKPSFCFFIPAEESMRRSNLKNEPFSEDIEMRQKRIELYLSELKNDRWEYIIDATRSIDEVFSDICSKL